MANEIDSGIYRIHKNNSPARATSSEFVMTAEAAREIRDLSVRKLQEMTGSARRPQQSYIVQDDHLCGIRYRIENFATQWKAGENEVAVLREGKEIERMEIQSLSASGGSHQESRRAA